MTTRRKFIQIVPATGLALLGTQVAMAADVDPKSPQAAAVGYIVDATKVDKKKYPKYAAGQICGNCVLYQGKPTDAVAPCAIFPGKTVPAKAWCSAYAKKA